MNDKYITVFGKVEEKFNVPEAFRKTPLTLSLCCSFCMTMSVVQVGLQKEPQALTDIQEFPQKSHLDNLVTFFFLMLLSSPIHEA